MSNLKVFNNSTRRKFLKILGVSLVGTLGYSLYNSINKNNLKKSYWTGSVINAPARIEIHSADNKLNSNIIKKIDDLVLTYENIFNLQNNNSEISLLNRNKTLHNASPELIEVIKKSQYISYNTEGLFDITVQPLWELYYSNFILNNKSLPPDENKINETLKLVNWKNVKVSNDMVSLQNQSSITLNGIAQGWITDKITALLIANGFTNTLVDFGESYAAGLYEEKRNWNILIQGKNTDKVVSLSNKAIATSAGHGTIFEPTMKYHHIFNTKSGLSSNNFKTVSIISKKAWMADAISTSALSMNKESLLELSKNLNVEAIVQEKNKLIALS